MVVGLDYAIIQANAALLDRLGQSAGQAVGLHCYQVLRNAEAPCHENGEQCPILLVLETGRPASIIQRQTNAKGYRCYNEIEAFPLIDGRGRPVSVLYVASELGLAERHKRIVDTMETGVAVVSHSGRLVDVNEALCRMLGYTREELADKNVAKFITGELALSFRDVAEQNAPPQEIPIERKDGSAFAAELSVSQLPLGPVTLYVGFVRDVTLRNQREETISRQARALAQSEAQYRAIFDGAGDALMVLEDDTTVAMVNRRFEEVTGFSSNEVEGKMSGLDLVSEMARQRASELHRMRRERPEEVPASFQQVMAGKKGRMWLAEISGAMVPGSRRSLIAMRDVTEAHKLREEALNRNRELEALHSVTAVVSRFTNLDDMLQRVLDRVLAIMGLPRGCVYLLDEERKKLFIRSHAGASGSTVEGIDGLELGEGYGGRVAQTGEALFIPDMEKDPRTARLVVLADGFRCLASIPLVSGGKVLGTMSLDGKEVREFSPELRRLLVSIGNEIGVAVERAQLLQRAQDRARELESLVSVTREMVSSLELQEVLDRTLDIMCRQVGATPGFICMLDESSRELTAKTIFGERAAPLGRVWKMGEGIVGWVAQHQEPMLVHDISRDARIQGSQAPSAIHSTIAVPLKVKEKLLGVVVVASLEREAFNTAHVRLLSAYAAQASMALENAVLHQAVKKQASTDELTQLFNRRYFYPRLAEETRRARRYGRPLALLFLDVDDLKLINDRYGHLQGDRLLQHLASLFAEVVRDTDVAARLGGDEFVILLPETTREEAGRVAERLLAEATPCPLLSGGSVPWQMSIGVAWAPVEGSYEVDLLRLADEAVYRAKGAGTRWELARSPAHQLLLPLDGDPQVAPIPPKEGS